VSLTSGTGANQADKIFSDRRTLSASANEDLDLAGSLGGLLGGTVVFAEIIAVLVSAAAGNTNSVIVTRPAANGAPLFVAAGDGITLLPGATFAWFMSAATAVAVTAGTGDLINFANSGAGTSVEYDVMIVGRSA
jgi:hypothetical protein